VPIVNVPAVDPSGTKAIAGASAAALLAETVTLAPPVGAAALRVTVPVSDEPPGADDELSVTDWRCEGPRKGFETKNASDTPFVSVATRFVEAEPKAMAVPPGLIAGNVGYALPAVPSGARLTAMVSSLVMSRMRTSL
jgi:hypothetical protein